MTEPSKGQRRRSPQTGEISAGTPASGSRDHPDIDLTATEQGGPPAVPPQTPPADDDVLVLPVGALVAMRRSGGLIFSSRVVVVYPDGHLATSTVGGGRSSRGGMTRALPAAQLATLRHILDGIDFARLQSAPAGHPRPDAYAYEIAVRAGRKPVSLEVFEGTIPSTLAPLLALLNGVLTDGD